MLILSKVLLASATMLLLFYKASKEDYNLFKASFNSLLISEKNLPHQFAHWLKKDSDKKFLSFKLKVKEFLPRSKPLDNLSKIYLDSQQPKSIIDFWHMIRLLVQDHSSLMKNQLLGIKLLFQLPRKDAMKT